jgi:hypothetical protein
MEHRLVGLIRDWQKSAPIYAFELPAASQQNQHRLVTGLRTRLDLPPIIKCSSLRMS